MKSKNLLACIAIFTLTGIFPARSLSAAGTGSRDAPGVSIADLQQLFGKSTSSPEFLNVKVRCSLKLVSEKKETDLIFSKHPPPKRRIVRLQATYGGSGLIVVAGTEIWIEAHEDLNNADEPSDLKVGLIQLIVGKCDEEFKFGLWRGEMPFRELPGSPDLLFRKFGTPDSHSVIARSENGGLIKKEERRVISYASPFVEEIPLFDVFYFENDSLTLMRLSPPRRPSRIVPPQAP